MAFVRHFRSLMGSLGLEVEDGPVVDFGHPFGLQPLFYFRESEYTAIIWPCSRSEVPKEGLHVAIGKFRETFSGLSSSDLSDLGLSQATSARLLLVREDQGIYSKDWRAARSGDIKIHVWDSESVKYYKDLQVKIGKYARNSLLGELEVHPAKSESIKVLAFRVSSPSSSTHGRVNAYTFSIDPKRLLEIAYVARREVRGESFYQRLLKKPKIQSISRFIDRGNIIPNNIILAFGENIRRQVSFEPVPLSAGTDVADSLTVGLLEFPRDYRSLWIIDGQHRLFGFARSQSSIELIVTVFQNLDLPEQAKMFVDINKNQTPVGSDLVWDLEGELTPETERGVISRVVKYLGQLPPLSGKIYVPSMGMKKKGQLTLSGFCTAILKVRIVRPTTRSGSPNPWYAEESSDRVENIASGLAKFFKEFRRTLREEWFGGDARGLATFDGGIALIVRLIERFVGRISMDHAGAPDSEDYGRFLNALDRVLTEDYATGMDRKELRQRLSSEGGREQITKELCLKIREVLADAQFCEDLVREWEGKFRPIEQKLKFLINARMTEVFGPSWFDQRVEGDVKKQIAVYMESDGEKRKRLRPYYLTLGHSVNLIRKELAHFEADLLASEGPKAGFPTRQAVDTAFSHMTRMRNRFQAHTSPHRMTREDERQLELYLERFGKLLAKVTET